MKFIQRVTTFFNTLSTKNFYLYMGIFFGVLFLVHGLVIFRHFSVMKSLDAQFTETNELRQEKVQPLLINAHHVRDQRKQVDILLAKDPDFKLGSYVKNLLTDFNVLPNKESESTSQTEREEKYLETVTTLKLVGINMQQLAELLDNIEHEPRVNAKAIEIIKSRKRPNTIDVILTVAALQQK